MYIDGYFVKIYLEICDMNQSKLSSKFQLSIPKAIRNEQGLEAGQQFTIITRGDIIELIPLKPILSARGMLARSDYHSSDYRDRVDRNL